MINYKQRTACVDSKKHIVPHWPSTPKYEPDSMHPTNWRFQTNVLPNATILPESPAYNDEASPFTALRNFITGPGSKSQGDPNKFAKTIYSLVESGNIPLHLPIGKDALEMAKEAAELREKEISGAVPWSTDLLRDDLY